MSDQGFIPGCLRYFKNYQPDELEALVSSCGFTFIHSQDYRPHRTNYINHIYQKEVAQ